MTESVVAATVAMRSACPARGDDGFLALLRNDGDLHHAALDVEDRIRGVSL
jgi:hypothetical protein